MCLLIIDIVCCDLEILLILQGSLMIGYQNSSRFSKVLLIRNENTLKRLGPRGQGPQSEASSLRRFSTRILDSHLGGVRWLGDLKLWTCLKHWFLEGL